MPRCDSLSRSTLALKLSEDNLMSKVKLDKIQYMVQMQRKIRLGMAIMSRLQATLNAVIEARTDRPDSPILFDTANELDVIRCRIMDWMTDGGVK